jgi:hypothetical protein
MNAPLNHNGVEKRLLMAAIEELEAVYIEAGDPCVALLISRNYHLLAQRLDNIDVRLVWMQQARYWWQQYLKHTTGKYVDFGFLVQETFVFKYIDL